MSPDARPATVVTRAESACTEPSPTPHHPRAVVTAHAPEAAPGDRPRAIHLTIAGDPSRTLTVEWTTRAATRATALLYRPVDGREELRATGYSLTVPGDGDRRHHRVHLCGLRPATRYRYVVEGADAHHFVTAPDGPEAVRVLVVGDARDDHRTWGLLAARALAARPDVMVFTGDAVEDGAQPAMWDSFFAAAEALLAEVPALWVAGNHEGITAIGDARITRPANGDAEHPGRWWAVTYGPARIVGLDDVNLPPWGVVRRDEARFLARELAAVDRARTPWVITVHHAPMHTTSGGHLPEVAVRRAWGPLLDRHGVDFDLSGHTHNYQSSRPMRSDETVTDEATGTRYIAFGGAGAELYQFRGTAPWVQHQEVTHGWAMLSLDARGARWEAWRPDGSRIERIDRPARSR